VLNSNANVTEANGVISIAGFGTFAIPTVAAAAGRQGISVAKKMWQVCTQSLRLHLMTILKRTTLYLVFAQKEYCLISLVILMYGLSNLKQVVLTLVGRLLQLKLGFNDQVVKFSGTTTLIATFQPGYEGVSIESIEIRDVNTGVSQKYTWQSLLLF
jgi:hypothetical protein